MLTKVSGNDSPEETQPNTSSESSSDEAKEKNEDKVSEPSITDKNRRSCNICRLMQ